MKKDFIHTRVSSCFFRAYGSIMTKSIFSSYFPELTLFMDLFLTCCCEFIDAFTGYVILCKAAVNVHRVIFFFLLLAEGFHWKYKPRHRGFTRAGSTY